MYFYLFYFLGGVCSLCLVLISIQTFQVLILWSQLELLRLLPAVGPDTFKKKDLDQRAKKEPLTLPCCILAHTPPSSQRTRQQQTKPSLSWPSCSHTRNNVQEILRLSLREGRVSGKQDVSTADGK